MDYLRQLENDEKRSRFIIVATVTGADLVGPLDPIGALLVSGIPDQSVVGKIYAVVTEPFAAGATLTWGFTDDTGAVGDDLLTDLDLVTAGTTRSQKPDGGIYTYKTKTGIIPNAAAFDSSVGIVKLCIEITETNVKSGKYSA